MKNEKIIGEATLLSLNLLSKLYRDRKLEDPEMRKLLDCLLVCVAWLVKEINDDLG